MGKEGAPDWHGAAGGERAADRAMANTLPPRWRAGSGKRTAARERLSDVTCALEAAAPDADRRRPPVIGRLHPEAAGVAPRDPLNAERMHAAAVGARCPALGKSARVCAGRATCVGEGRRSDRRSRIEGLAGTDHCLCRACIGGTKVESKA